MLGTADPKTHVATHDVLTSSEGAGVRSQRLVRTSHHYPWLLIGAGHPMG